MKNFQQHNWNLDGEKAVRPLSPSSSVSCSAVRLDDFVIPGHRPPPWIWHRRPRSVSLDCLRQASHPDVRLRPRGRIARHVLAISAVKAGSNVPVGFRVRGVKKRTSSVYTATGSATGTGSELPQSGASRLLLTRIRRYVERLRRENVELLQRNHEYLDMLKTLSGNVVLPLADRGAIAELIAKVLIVAACAGLFQYVVNSCRLLLVSRV